MIGYLKIEESEPNGLMKGYCKSYRLKDNLKIVKIDFFNN
jgi:hypothetical protein